MSRSPVKDLLCPLQLADRVAKCDELLLQDLLANEQIEVCYFKGHALYELDRLAEALEEFDEGLAIPASDAELRAKCLSGKAMVLYDFGRLDEMSVVLQAAELIPLPSTAKAMSLKALQQVLWGLHDGALGRPSGFERFITASVIYQQAEDRHGVDWAQLNAALAAIQSGKLSEAAESARQVQSEALAPLARLLEAQVLYMRGDVERSQQLVDQVLSGAHGQVAASHRSRASYLAALKAYDAGDLLSASVHLNEALDHLAVERRKELDLRRDIYNLRAQIAQGKEVA